MAREGVVLSMHLRIEHGQHPPERVEHAQALVGLGLAGDAQAKDRKAGSPRQVLLVDRRRLEAFGFSHGALREQLTVDFEDLESLPKGTRLQVGEATLEVSMLCEPCWVIGAHNEVDDPLALKEQLEGRRGVLTRVVAVEGDGRIRVGDRVRVLEGTEA
jgi:MOSC domain-containing protein YiiM